MDRALLYGKLKSGRFIQSVHNGLLSFHGRSSSAVENRSEFVTVSLTSLYDMAEKSSVSGQ